MSTDSFDSAESVVPQTVADKWILSRFEFVLKKVTKNLDAHEFSQAAEILRDFTWSEFADWYLEIAKVQKLEASLKTSTDGILLLVMKGLLKTWHPFMPFVTEVIWKECKTDSLLMIEKWPEIDGHQDAHAEEAFEFLKELIVGIRNVRSQQKIEPKKLLKMVLVTSESTKKDLESYRSVIASLARVETDFLIEKTYEPESTDVSAVVKDVTIFVKLDTTIDPEKEKARIEKEIAQLRSYIESIQEKLSNQEFISKAPAKVVESMGQKKREAEEKLALLS